MRDEEEDPRDYFAVVNHEEQYSIWLAHRPVPAGWKPVGKRARKEECLDHIEQVWVDMRPLSLQKRLLELEKNPPPAPPPMEEPPRHPLGMDDLVERLQEEQAVEAGIRPERTYKYFRGQLDRKYVFMKFIRTGTELGIPLDANSDLTGADLEAGKGTIKVSGQIVLNYNEVRYHGTLDLETLSGSGRLEFIREVSPAELLSA